MSVSFFRASSVLLLVAVSISLFGCPRQSNPNALIGKWWVDTDATVARAKRDGLPVSVEPQIRETFSNGLLEITDDQLIMRVAGMEGSESVNYTASAQSGGCYDLTVMRGPQKHSYCVQGDQLVVKDPGASLSVVYRRQ